MRKATFILGGLLMASVACNVWQWDARKDEAVAVDTTSTVVIVEHLDTAPRARDEKTVGYVTLPRKSNMAGGIVGSNSNSGTDSGIADSVVIRGDTGLGLGDTFPVVQRKYAVDSLYTAYVSGPLIDTVGPRLDSICVRERVTRETITVTTARAGRRWSVGVVGGYGYGMESRRMEPFVGIGVTLGLSK